VAGMITSEAPVAQLISEILDDARRIIEQRLPAALAR
jgi:hypothetical protein